MLGRGGGAPDVHRAGLEIIRDACDGVILLLFFPPEVEFVEIDEDDVDDIDVKATLSEDALSKLKPEEGKTTGRGSKTRHYA